MSGHFIPPRALAGAEHEQAARRVDARGGLVAIGDSITRADGASMLGLAMRSWASWLADALRMPFVCLARNGAGVADALACQVPELAARYPLACVYIGVNDVRAPSWDQQRYARDFSALVAAVRRHCDSLLVLALPSRIGRPPAPASAIAEANRTIDRVASVHGALTLRLGDLCDSQLLMPDAVHLTARGEAHVALLAAQKLAAAGWRLDERELFAALELPR